MKTRLDSSFRLTRPALQKVVRCGCVILAAWLLLGAPGTGGPSVSSWAAEEAKKEETLTNKSIIELQQLNLGDAVIIEKIKTSKCDFDVSISGLKQLKEAKVSDAVIQAMISPKSAAPGSDAKPAVPADSNDPQAPHEPGVWLYEETNGQKKMSRLEPETFRMWTSAGPFGGAARAVLTGLNAPLQISSRRPVFYFYFGESGQGIVGTSSPRELPLAKFDLKPKTSERLLVVGSIAPFAGYNSGIKKQSLCPVDEERIASGIYKVVPRDELADGEYGFCQVTAGITAGKMFTFGIRVK